MKRKTTSLLLLVLLVTALAAANAGDSTNGHGTFTTGGSAVTAVVFDAKETSSGVTGRARFFDNSALSLDIEVDCLTVSGNTAIVGGTEAGGSTTYAFKVTDNGGGVTADRITLPQVNQTCATFNTLGNHALTSGDLEVSDQP
jgi:hypothetical protein